jgi:hypothetical protein
MNAWFLELALRASFVVDKGGEEVLNRGWGRFRSVVLGGRKNWFSFLPVCGEVYARVSTSPCAALNIFLLNFPLSQVDMSA